MALIDCDVSECIHNDGNHNCDCQFVDLQLDAFRWNEPRLVCSNYIEKED